MQSPNFSIGDPNLSIVESSIGETASDLDLCGKRKRGDEIEEIDGLIAKEAKAKESRHVLEFTDFDQLLHRFKDELIFEKEDFDLMRDYCESDDDTDMKEEMKRSLPFDNEPVLKYISQVRNSGVSPSNPNINILIVVSI